MTKIPQRHSLVRQTAAILADEIAAGTWTEWLPGERVLSRELQVSRNTIRSAVQELRKSGVVSSRQGAGNRIMPAQSNSRRPGSGSQDVALLTPGSLQELRQSQTLWIDDLRALLSARGCQLRSFYGPQFYGRAPHAALSKLCAKHPHSCWVLSLSNQSLQTWFMKNRIPCIVAGSVYSGIDLPFRDLDHRAISRHAAGVMLRAGHRRLAIVMERTRRAGDLATEEEFVESVRRSNHHNAQATVCTHDGTPEGIKLSLRRILSKSDRPTALFITNPVHYLTSATYITSQLGLRCPADISLVCRDHDPYLAYMVPEAARYVADPTTFAKALLRPVLDLVSGGHVALRESRIMPEFIRGASVAEPSDYSGS